MPKNLKWKKGGKKPCKKYKISKNIETGQNGRGNRINNQDDKKL